MTLEQIEQRLEALQAEKDKLTAELEQLKAEEQSEEIKPWRAANCCLYYYVDTDGRIGASTEGAAIKDKERLEQGNYYRTEALAEQDAKELALRGVSVYSIQAELYHSVLPL